MLRQLMDWKDANIPVSIHTKKGPPVNAFIKDCDMVGITVFQPIEQRTEKDIWCIPYTNINYIETVES